MLVAPYSPTMRLGQGYNTFTQELCAYDAVASMQPMEVRAESPNHLGYSATAWDPPSRIQNINQTVSYCSKFVNQVNEVAELLNIGGPKYIRNDATGCGNSLFIDFNKFYESDINYLIHIKVVNQHIVAPGLTSFTPIDGVLPSEFTRVYGDSFISGFVEGGEFSALVSIKLRDRSTEKDVREQIQARLDSRNGFVGGGVHGDISKGISINGEIAVSVSWNSGGNVKGATNWTLESLRAVILEFPEHVMSYPARTSAILTKYVNLRSFQGSANKLGSPLDYDRARFYSSTLLHAFLDYKLILYYIERATLEVARGESTLERATDSSHFTDLARQATTHYQDEMNKYNKQSKLHCADDDDDDGSSLSMIDVAKAKSNPPARPNELVPYSADIFGLDKAKRDCRVEMLKLIEEVNAVAAAPSLATDVDRLWQYLSPSVFRMLMPTVKDLGKEQAMKSAAEEAVRAAKTHAKVVQELTANLATTNSKLSAAEGELKKLRPYDFVPPIGVDTPLKLKSADTNKVIDFPNHSGDLLHQMDSQRNNGNQKFKLVKANSIGYHIVHIDTGHYVTLNPTSTGKGGGTHLCIRKQFGSIFAFRDVGNGKVEIRLADQPDYTVEVEGGSHDNGARFLLHKKHSAPGKWRLEAFQ